MGLVPLLLCLSPLAMVDALPQADDDLALETFWLSSQCGRISFYADQTYNCTIDSGKLNALSFHLVPEAKLKTTALQLVHLPLCLKT